MPPGVVAWGLFYNHQLKITDMPVCPNCSYVLDAETPIFGGRGPRPGDYSVCFSCGACLQFDRNLDHILLDEAVLTGLDISQPETARQLRAISYHVRRRGSFN